MTNVKSYYTMFFLVVNKQLLLVNISLLEGYHLIFKIAMR